MLTLDELVKIGDPKRVTMGSRLSERARREIADHIENVCGKHGLLPMVPVYEPQSDFSPVLPKVVGERACVPWDDDNTTDNVFGGLSLVNSQGKMTKRISRNLYKNYKIKYPAVELVLLGNLINENANAMGAWHYKITNDVQGNIGIFGDAGSCFRGGSEVYAIEEDYRAAMALIYDEDLAPYARAWVYSPYNDNALIFFNAYSREHRGQLRTRQIASIVARDLGTTTRRVDYDCNLYQNQNWAIAVGGERIDYSINIENYGEQCDDCGDYVHEDDGTWLEGREVTICNDCFRRSYFWCTHCDNPEHDDNCVTVKSGDVVCDDCACEYYSWCEHCSEHVDTDYMDKLHDEWYCLECYNEVAVECEECSDVVHQDNSVDTPTGICCGDCWAFCNKCDIPIAISELTSDGECVDCWKKTEDKDNDK